MPKVVQLCHGRNRREVNQIVNAYNKMTPTREILRRHRMSSKTMYSILEENGIMPNRRNPQSRLSVTEKKWTELENRVNQLWNMVTEKKKSTKIVSSKSFHDEAQRKRIVQRYKNGQPLQEIADSENIHRSYVDRTLERVGVERNRRSGRKAA